MTSDARRSFALVANPNAGRGRGEAVLRAVERTLSEAGCDVSSRRSTGPGEAVSLAAAAARRSPWAVVAIGGDGTVHEVLNGLMRVEPELRPAMGVVPAGTGNDYALELGVPMDDLGQAARILLEPRVVDAGVGRLEGCAGGSRFFGVGVGFAVLAEASARLRRSRPLPGRLSYFVGGVAALFSVRAPELEVDIAGQVRRGRYLAVHVGLCATTGGGYRLAPGAGLGAGALHVATVAVRPRVLALLEWPWISRGRRLHGVEVAAGGRVRVAGEPGMLLHVDGEVLRAPEGSVEATLLPRALRVLATEGSATR